MKNKKINIKTIIIIVLIGIIISMFFIILNMKKNNIVGQEIRKEQLGETTTDNTYVELQTHLSEVNEKEQKLLSFKTKVASAITDMGVETSNEADADTMASNIRSISAVSTEEGSYILTSSVTGANTDTTGMYMIIEFTYSNIIKYTKFQKTSQTWTELIGYTSKGEKVTIANSTDIGEYDISNFAVIKVSHIYRPNTSISHISLASSKESYKLKSTVTGAGADTTGMYMIIEFNYSDIEGCTKIQKTSETRTALIGYTSKGEEVTIANSTDIGEYDISNYETVKVSHIYRPTMKDVFIPNLLP